MHGSRVRVQQYKLPGWVLLERNMCAYSFVPHVWFGRRRLLDVRYGPG